jgi:hypothetical protein
MTTTHLLPQLHLTHADGQRIIALDNISNVYTAQFLPSGNDLLVTDSYTQQQTLILGYYRNNPQAALEDNTGNRLEGLQLQAMTTLFVSTLKNAPTLTDVLRESMVPQPVKGTSTAALRTIDIGWGDIVSLSQEHLLDNSSAGASARSLQFRVSAMMDNAFLLCDAVVLREGDVFSYADIVAGHVELHHDETSSQSGQLYISVSGENDALLDDIILDIRVAGFAPLEYRAAAGFGAQAH